MTNRLLYDLSFFAALLLVGCNGKPPPLPAAKPDTSRPLRLLVIDDPPLAEQIGKIWNARSTAKLEVRAATWQETTSASQLAADLVVYPAGLLGTLAERGWIAPLSAERLEGEPYQSGDVLPLGRLRETVWGEQTYAVTFGSPLLCLVYRPDLLEPQGLKPPTTWKEAQVAVEALAKVQAKDSEGKKWSACCEPLAEGWAGQMLLARAASYVRHSAQYSDVFNMDTMEPQIATPPFVRALEELVACAKADPRQAALDMAPADAWKAVATGQCALAITWPPPPLSDAAKVTDEAANLAIAPLPGAEEVYRFDQNRWDRHAEARPVIAPLVGVAGRLGSVCAVSRRKDAAEAAIALLASPSWSEQISPRSDATTLFRFSQLAGADGWAALDRTALRQYADALEQAQQADVWMMSIRLPGRERYLTALDLAVRRALQDEASPQEALTQAAATWREVTADLGVDAQRRAYRRSLGIATD